MDTYICNFATKVHKIIKTTATSPQKTRPSPLDWRSLRNVGSVAGGCSPDE